MGEPKLITTGLHGINWKRRPGGTSTPEEFVTAQKASIGWHDTESQVAREWNWWQPGRSDAEWKKVEAVLFQWEPVAPPPGGYKTAKQVEDEFAAREAARERERLTRAEHYDQELAVARLKMLSAQATAGFMGHVIAKPDSAQQRAKAEELLAASETQAAALAMQVGDPDAVVDEHGDLPAERRRWNLRDHMTLFRHRLLREWSEGQRQRYRQLLAMPVLRAADMCSECQAPTDWHTYALSVRLFLADPEPGSRAEAIERAMPGWWSRCPACTDYQIHHRWGGRDTLPGFNGEQWQNMLTPSLRAIFAPKAPTPRRRRQKARSAVLEQQLRETEAQAEQLRNQLAALNENDGNE